jgi:hypothetical protein
MEPLHGRLDGVGGRRRGGLGPDPLGEEDALLLHLCEGDVDRHLEVDRARSAGRRDPQGLGDLIRDAIDVGNAVGPLGDGAQERHLIEAGRERQPLVLGERRCAADHEQRDRVDVGVHDAAHGVGDAGPRGHDRDAGSARGARPAVGRLHRRLLVSRVDHAEAVPPRRHQDRVEMPAVQGEELANPCAFEHANEQLTSVDLAHAAPLLSLEDPSIARAGVGRRGGSSFATRRACDDWTRFRCPCRSDRSGGQVGAVAASSRRPGRSATTSAGRLSG